MMNYCPVCKSSLIWISSDDDNNGTELFYSSTYECTECGLVAHELVTYTRTKVEATFEFKEED